MPVYVMQTRGGTHGAETNQWRSYEPGDKIEAPKGEFRHLSDGAYETRPMQPENSSSEAELELGEHKGAGYYYVRKGGERLTRDGEPITVGQGEDEARQQLSNIDFD